MRARFVSKIVCKHLEISYPPRYGLQKNPVDTWRSGQQFLAITGWEVLIVFIAKKSSPASPLLWGTTQVTFSLLYHSLSYTAASTSLGLFFVPGSLTLILKSPLNSPSESSGTPGLVSSTQNSSLSSPQSPGPPPCPCRPLAHSSLPPLFPCWQQGTYLPSSRNILQSSPLSPPPSPGLLSWNLYPISPFSRCP